MNGPHGDGSNGPSFDELYSTMVAGLRKDPVLIASELSHRTTTVDLLHAIIGIAGEAGEMLDSIKKTAIYNQNIHYENLLEEAGDLEFYLEQFYQATGFNRDQARAHNMNKLAKRYPGYSYTDLAAKVRADKENGE